MIIVYYKPLNIFCCKDTEFLPRVGDNVGCFLKSEVPYYECVVETVVFYPSQDALVSIGLTFAKEGVPGYIDAVVVCNHQNEGNAK